MNGADFAVMSARTKRDLPDGVVSGGCEILIEPDFPHGTILFVTQEDLTIIRGPVPYEIQKIMDQVWSRIDAQ